MMKMSEADDDDAFSDVRRIVVVPGVPWNGSYRWFRSPNVIPFCDFLFRTAFPIDGEEHLLLARGKPCECRMMAKAS
jgi:hypothetical protein